MPILSVVISIFNNAQHLEDSLCSVLNQTFQDFEVLIIDDCSTDSSVEIVQGLQDKRVLLTINSVNHGLTRNLNTLIAKASGNYIARFDGDDICLPSRFEKQINYLEQHPDISLVSSSAILISEDGKEICQAYRPKSGRIIQRNIQKKNNIIHPSVMLRKSVFDKMSYDQAFRTGQDWDLWKRMDREGFLFGHINEPLIKYRLNPKSVRGIWKPGSDPDYFYAHICMNNRRKLRALYFFPGIRGVKNKLKFLVKFIIPNWLRSAIKKFCAS